MLSRSLTVLLLVCSFATLARAEFRIGDACRVKGQEENVLQGMGIVAGLKGTGDGDSKPTQRALAQMMEVMARVGPSPSGLKLDELKNAKNVALVFVTAKVPPGGAQPGDFSDCTLSAVSAKSLEGGYLMISALKGPNPRDPIVYATAQGLLVVDDVAFPQTARIPNGATIEREFRNEFLKDGKITLIIDKEYASFEMSSAIEELINSPAATDFRKSGASESEGIAKARGQDRVEVTIPDIYKDQAESFIGIVMGIRMSPVASNNSVIVNKRLQAVIVGADVEIAPVAVMHKNRVIQTGGVPPANQFVPLDIAESDGGRNTKLKSLVDALNALQIPTDDVIDIIIMLKQKRALSGQLIVQ